MHQHSTAPRPSSETVALRWNLAFSFDAASAFFCALSAWQTPIVVGMAEMTSRPIGMVSFPERVGLKLGI
jgi:hypothetical protein